MSSLGTNGADRLDHAPPALTRWGRGTLWFGLAGLATYIGGWAVGGWLRDGYDPAEQTISELFELGAPWASRGVMVVSLVAGGLAFLALALVLDRALPGRGRLGPLLVVVAGLGTLGVVAAPCTPGCPGATTSAFDFWHTVAAGGGYVALSLAPVAFAVRIRRFEPRLAIWSAVIGLVAFALFAIYVAGWIPYAHGVQQRLFNTVGDAWYALVAIWLLRRDRQRRSSASMNASATVR